MRLPIQLSPRETHVLHRFLTVMLGDSEVIEHWQFEQRYLNAVLRKVYAAMLKEGIEP